MRNYNMDAEFVLALDAGTTSSRAILFDARGEIAGTSQEEFPQIYPKPGWVEHDPEQIWETQLRVLVRSTSFYRNSMQCVWTGRSAREIKY